MAQLAGNGALVPLLLLLAALAAPIGRWVRADTWNEVQLERWLESHEVDTAERMKED